MPRPAVLMLAMCALVTACAGRLPIQTALESRASGIRAHHDSNGYTVAIDSGNLIEAPVFSAEERVLLLADFINIFRGQLGGSGSAPLSFVADGSEFDFQFQGRLMAGVKLLQSARGLRILDAEQLGVYDQESGTLRAVTVRLADATALVAVKPPASREGIVELARAFLQARSIEPDSMTVVSEPAYSLALGKSGYEVRCTSTVAGHMPSLIQLLVNPDTKEVAFLSRRQFH